jgi:hypothetical protein
VISSGETPAIGVLRVGRGPVGDEKDIVGEGEGCNASYTVADKSCLIGNGH